MKEVYRGEDKFGNPNPYYGTCNCPVCGKGFIGKHRSNADAFIKMLTHLVYEHPEHEVAQGIIKANPELKGERIET